MKSIIRRSPYLPAVLLALACAACGGGRPYRVAPLGPLPGVDRYSSQAFGINRRNQVVGRIEETRGAQHAVLWEPDGRVVELASSVRMAAWGINDGGEVVGSGFLAGGGPRAFRWERGVLRPLDIPGAVASAAHAIGASGDIAGGYAVAGAPPSQWRTFLWTRGAVRDLGPYPSGTGVGFAVEKHAQVVGARLADPADPRSPHHAFLWYGEVARDLGVLPGGVFSTATAIVVTAWPPDAAETRFTIVGESDVGAGPVVSNVHGFVYTRGRMRDMGTLPGFPRVLPAALNGNGVAVGTMENADRSIQRAFIYSGVVVDLNTLIPEDSGWVLESASAINNAGYIVGWGQLGGERRAFLLSPR